MNFDFQEILSITMVLFAVIDVIGALPVIIDLRVKVGKIHAEKASFISLLIMVVFLFVGEQILKIIGIDLGSFAIAGAFVLFFIAVEMILGIRLYKDSVPATASVVPIAFPLIAGAGTITTLLSLKAQYHTENIVVGIVVNIILVYAVLKNTLYLEKLLGEGGINIMRKVFGVILLALAVKLFRSNATLLL